jgi:hypothetical protein
VPQRPFRRKVQDADATCAQTRGALEARCREPPSPKAAATGTDHVHHFMCGYKGCRNAPAAVSVTRTAPAAEWESARAASVGRQSSPCSAGRRLDASHAKLAKDKYCLSVVLGSFRTVWNLIAEIVCRPSLAAPQPIGGRLRVVG